MKPRTEQPDYTAEDMARFERVEADFRERLAGWWERAGIEPHYPCDTSTALRLLNAVEYRADQETFHRYVASGYFIPPGKLGDDVAWLATNIADFGAALERRRMWHAFSALHDHKKTQFERGHEQAQRAGVDGPVIRDLDKHTVEDLLLYMRDADNRTVREALHLALKLKLEHVDRLHE